MTICDFIGKMILAAILLAVPASVAGADTPSTSTSNTLPPTYAH